MCPSAVSYDLTDVTVHMPRCKWEWWKMWIFCFSWYKNRKVSDNLHTFQQSKIGVVWYPLYNIFHYMHTQLLWSVLLRLYHHFLVTLCHVISYFCYGSFIGTGLSHAKAVGITDPLFQESNVMRGFPLERAIGAELCVIHLFIRGKLFN